jgi:hypothetical protein
MRNNLGNVLADLGDYPAARTEAGASRRCWAMMMR